MISQRSAMFIKRCLHSDSPVDKHVTRHGVFLWSCIDRNLFTCSEHYDVSVNDIVHDAVNRYSVKLLFERRTPPVYYSNAVATLELL